VYPTVLAIHSYLRWAVLLLALVAVARAWSGWRTSRAWTPADDKVGRFFGIALDLQVLIGLILYVAVSPLTRAAFQDFGAAMGNSVLRFFAVEHIFGMLVASALVHVGRARSRRNGPSILRHRSAFIFFALGLLAMLASIPWPFLPAGRPLFFHWPSL
jgi:hypothetical protein